MTDLEQEAIKAWNLSTQARRHSHPTMRKTAKLNLEALVSSNPHIKSIIRFGPLPINPDDGGRAA